MDLTRIEKGFMSKHPFVGKWVTIKMHGTDAGRSLKGREVFAHSHDWVKNTFSVNVGNVGPPVQETIHARTMWLK